jgi:flagellar motor switch protein FliN
MEFAVMQDLSPSELEAIFKVIDPSALPKKNGLKDPGHTEEQTARPVTPSLSRAQFTQFKESAPSDNLLLTKETLQNIQLRLDVVLGRSHITLAKLLELKSGNTLTLDKLAGEPVDIELNGHVIAKGEIVVVDDNFGIQITQLSPPTNTK